MFARNLLRIFLMAVLPVFLVVLLISTKCDGKSPMRVTVKVPKLSDPALDDAMAQAQASLTNFISALRSPKASQKLFTISARYVSEEQHFQEDIWVTVSSYQSNMFRGVVATTEKTAIGLNFRQPVEVNVSNVVDWMFVEDDRIVGGFAARVRRSRMTDEQRRIYDASNPYKY